MRCSPALAAAQLAPAARGSAGLGRVCQQLRVGWGGWSERACRQPADLGPSPGSAALQLLEFGKPRSPAGFRVPFSKWTVLFKVLTLQSVSRTL